MEKIFLTGGNGFFGKRFTNAYSSKYEILSTDVDTLDITDEEQVIKTIVDFNPDYIIHAAAVADTGFCENNKDLARKINVDGAKYVALAAKKVDAKLVFFSTEQVFNGNTNGAPFKEIDEPVPNTQYGITKLEAESEIKNIHDKIWILRFTWLFGLPERNLAINPNILWDTIQIALKGKAQKVTCNEYRGLTYVYDIIDQFEKVFNLEYGTYHTGSNNDLSRYEISRVILEKLGMDQDKIEELIIKDEDKYSECARNVRLDTGKIKRCGFEFDDTKVSVEKCLREFRYIK
jgi:dTDP-4-dehydrorhamnose reductase